VTAPRSFTVATYNILADAYIRPERYPRCDPKLFASATRRPRLVERIIGLDADVVCLQEAEYGAFAAIDEALRPRGYAGRWAHKGRGKPDGCATFVRAPFACLESRVLVFDDGHLADGPSGHVALKTLVGRNDWAVTIVNTHLKWDAPDAPPERRYGLTQAAALLDGMLTSAFPVVVCGDFNAEPSSPLLEAFGRGGFVDAHPASAATFNTANGPAKLDFLLHRLDLSSSPRPSPPIDAATALPSASEPSDHIPLVARFTPS